MSNILVGFFFAGVLVSSYLLFALYVANREAIQKVIDDEVYPR
jgi:hypothetical protein